MGTWCERAGVSHGVCGLIGLSDEQLTHSISQREGLYLHAMDSDAAAVARLRAATDHRGWYGHRVAAEVGTGENLPYANQLIDLLVVPLKRAEQLAAMSPAELLRVLRPGGLAVVGQRTTPTEDSDTGVTAEVLKQWLDHAGLDQAALHKDAMGTWVWITKPYPEGAGSWSHWEHGPDNNPVSEDALIKAPYMTQWLGDPLYIAMPAVTTAAGGRVFIAMGHIAHHQREEEWLNTLMARNGYNGTVLWKRKLPDGYMAHRSAFIATAETFYMIDPAGGGVIMLDPQTGREKGRLRAEDAAGDWKWIALQDGKLFALAGTTPDPAETTIVRSELPSWSWGELSPGYYTERVPWGFGTTLVAMDASSGEQLWVRQEDAEIDSRAMVMGGGRLFYYCPDSHLSCLAAETGETVWHSSDARLRDLINQPGRGLTSTPGFRSSCYALYSPEALVYQAQTHMHAVAVSPMDGRLLWYKPKTTSNPNMLYADERLYLGLGPDGTTLSLEPATGQIFGDLGFKKRSCARLTATSDSFFCRGWPEGLTRFDRQAQEVEFNGAFRPSCNDGVVAANGLLYLGPWACDCNLSVMGRVALCSAAEFQPPASSADSERLFSVRNDLASVQTYDASRTDWTTYRGDLERSASSKAPVAAELTSLWNYPPERGYRPTAPIAVGDLVFVGGDDGKLRALDASTGELRWQYFTAGPILQSPTFWQGRLYLGSADGYLHAVEAVSGEPLWQFRLAPAERRLMVYGHLSSTWPVHSGVVVRDGVAYASAGIIDYDGTYVCGVDAVTGEPQWVNGDTGHLDAKLRKGVSAQGNLTVAQDRLWMASGNVVSPASYHLADGRYAGALVVDGSPQSNRGEELGVYRGRYLIQGGRLRFSALRNVVDPGNFVAQEMRADGSLGPAVPLLTGKIAPAWNDEHFVMVNGRKSPPICYYSQAMEEYFADGRARHRPRPKWTADALQGTDTISLALAGDAVVAVCETPLHRQLQSSWKVCTLSLASGELIAQQNLPGEALPGGLAIDRRGRVLVALQDGTVVSLGLPGA